MLLSNSSHPLYSRVKEINVVNTTGNNAIKATTLYNFKVEEQSVMHWWYRGWEDFEVPPEDQWGTVITLAMQVWWYTMEEEHVD